MIDYLAGVFDAEVYVRIRRTVKGTRVNFTPEIKIEMTNKEIIEIFCKRYDVKISTYQREGFKKTYIFALGVRKLRETSFIDDMLPICNEKRLQLQEVWNVIRKGENLEAAYIRYMEYKKSFSHPIRESLSFEYLAGVLDGDGYLSMFNASRGTGNSVHNIISVGLEQRYKPMVDYFANLTNCNIHEPLIKDYNKHTKTFCWQSNSVKVLPLLIEIEPFLIEKREKAIKMIEYIQKLIEFKDLSKNTLTWWQDRTPKRNLKTNIYNSNIV